MTNYVYALHEVNQGDYYFHAIFANRIDAKKSARELKRKVVTQALENYRLTGEFPDAYRHCWDGVALYVSKEKVIGAKDGESNTEK